ncbi:MAG TPA: hypothetical protein VF681_09790 [Abditibacteriaceae bacterium]|jgi:uncharacterized cysteine cluster protein YcgN (CxxCxxCC family)
MKAESSESKAVFVAYSDADLRDVCRALTQILALSLFDFDSEDTWEYTSAANVTFKVNVTKTENLDTISQWMPAAPHDCNYQLIFEWRSAEDFVPLLSTILQSLLHAPVTVLPGAR